MALGDWSESNKGLTAKTIETLAIDPQNPENIYAGTYGRIFRSTDGCASWIAANSDDIFIEHTHTLVIDPQNPANIYAYSEPQYDLLKSTGLRCELEFDKQRQQRHKWLRFF